jgi:hypothetical protein
MMPMREQSFVWGFAFAPETDDAPDYSGRKYGYSLTVFIVCDCYRRIRFILTG